MKNEFAIASLIVGILAFVQFLGAEKAALAIVFGALALREMKKQKLKGKWLAICGVTLGVAYYSPAHRDVAIYSPDVGQCRVIAPARRAHRGIFVVPTLDGVSSPASCQVAHFYGSKRDYHSDARAYSKTAAISSEDRT